MSRHISSVGPLRSGTWTGDVYVPLGPMWIETAKSATFVAAPDPAPAEEYDYDSDTAWLSTPIRRPNGRPTRDPETTRFTRQRMQ